MSIMENAITVNSISKLYRIYDSPRDRLKELLSLTKKKYYQEFRALDGVSFEVGQGETMGIIGRNGSGKSTLLQIICGILKPTSGTIETTGKISALLELGTGFNPDFTGRENIFLNGALMGYTREEMEGRYDDILDFADIGDFINQPVKTYSTGMYVRLAFACAVNVDPEILIVDEALSVGDVFFQQKCYRKMSEFRDRGKTLLFVTHDMQAVLKNCGSAVYLDKGKVIKVGESKSVINHYLETVLTRGEPSARGAGDERPGKHLLSDLKGAAPTEDRCTQRPNYNKNEFRYGNFKANIVDFSMSGPDGKEKPTYQSGEVMTFRFEVVFNAPVEFPIYGFTVKTKDGVTVYGNNSWNENVKVEAKSRGDRVLVELRQDMDLLSGDFFISAGVAELTDKGVDPVDRRYDLAYLGIISSDKSFGLANLHSKIDVRDLGDDVGRK